MFKNVSMTGVGLVLFIAKIALAKLGIVDIDDTTLERVISTGWDFATLLIAAIGQARRKDLKLGMMRK